MDRHMQGQNVLVSVLSFENNCLVSLVQLVGRAFETRSTAKLV
jgi:hypothetical protein